MTHTYTTLNGKVMQEIIGSGANAHKLDFIYDVNGKPFALKHYRPGTVAPETYYYVLNLQGDVVKLVEILVSGDSIWSYAEVAKYTYNAWGELISVQDQQDREITDLTDVAHLNPLRYRGYYYDTETGFYYLQSRYYDPVNCRFINADGYTDTDTGFLGYNMFAYCNNCPTINIDPTGEGIASFLLITFGIALLLGGCSSDESDYPYYMNCYAYAMGWDKNPNTGKQFDVLPSPGILADQPLTEAEMGLRGEEAEGLYSSRIRADCAAAGYYFNEVSTANHTPKPGNWLIVVAYSTGVNDFHMYRKGSEGWTHMSAMSGVTRLDHEQNVIIDPKACNRGLHNVFVGYYEVGPNRG